MKLLSAVATFFAPVSRLSRGVAHRRLFVGSSPVSQKATSTAVSMSEFSEELGAQPPLGCWDPSDETEGGELTCLQAEDEIQDDYYKSLTFDDLGAGWFNRNLENIHQDVVVEMNRRYFTTPRRNDQDKSMAADHPLRVICKAIHDAPDGSLVRVAMLLLTDPYAIDMLVHYGNTKKVRLILQRDRKNSQAMEKFERRFGTVASDAFRSNVELEWVNLDTPLCSRYSLMHMKTVITDTVCLMGSYNFSCAARFASCEHLVALPATVQDTDHFDSLWNLLRTTRTR